MLDVRSGSGTAILKASMIGPLSGTQAAKRLWVDKLAANYLAFVHVQLASIPLGLRVN